MQAILLEELMSNTWEASCDKYVDFRAFISKIISKRKDENVAISAENVILTYLDSITNRLLKKLNLKILGMYEKLVGMDINWHFRR